MNIWSATKTRAPLNGDLLPALTAILEFDKAEVYGPYGRLMLADSSARSAPTTSMHERGQVQGFDSPIQSPRVTAKTYGHLHTMCKQSTYLANLRWEDMAEFVSLYPEPLYEFCEIPGGLCT